MMYNEQYDMIVVGLGTAGSMAAITAAQLGLKVLGIEKQSCMGGTGTAGGVLGYYFGNNGGRYTMIDRKANEMKKDQVYTPSAGNNAEIKKLQFDQTAASLGIHVAYESSVIDVHLHNHEVKGISWIGPYGRKKALTKIVIDSTADGEVCSIAGVSMHKGRVNDGQSQPFTNVILEIYKDKVRATNTDAGYVNQFNPWGFSRAVVESALQPSHLKESYTDHPKWIKISPLLGVREGRFIEGEESVTFEKYINGKYTEEPIFYAYANFDNHSKDIAFESELQQNWSVVASLWGINVNVPIPVGALIPKGMKGIMVAGRHLAVDHDMASAVRMQRDMKKCGEAAATAAALAIQADIDVRDVEYSKMRDLLLETGCLNTHVAPLKEVISHQDVDQIEKAWMIDAEEIKEGLNSEKPGIAIWSAWRVNQALKQHLYQWIQPNEPEHLRKHSALTLGLMKDQAAIPLLRQMVQEKDGYVSKTSRKYNSVRGYTAIYLLGVLRDQGIVDDLLAILQNPDLFENVTINSEFITSPEEYYFQYFSFSFMALLKIGDAHLTLRHKIIEGLAKALNHPDLIIMITLKASNQLKYDMKAKMYEMYEKQRKDWNTT